MRLLLMRWLAAGLGACLWFATTAPAPGQFRPVPPQSGYQPPTQTQMVSNPVAPPTASFSSLPSPSPYWPYPPTWPIYSPAGAYLSGASDVINSQGNFLVQKRQSQVIHEQAKQAQIDTQRKAFEQWQWEQSQMPKLQDVRQQQFEDALARARGFPPQADIWSGWALNTLLQAIQRNQANTGLRGPTVPIDPASLKLVNFTTGTTSTTAGSIGMIRNGKLEWPDALLSNQAFAGNREKVDKLVGTAFQELSASGRVGADTIASLRKNATALRSDLRDQAAEMGSNDYVRGLRFVNQLNDAIDQMARPNAANYVDGTWQATGSTVGELVQQMTSKGLRFAPATTGNENVYSALYDSFIAYDSGLTRMARR